MRTGTEHLTVPAPAIVSAVIAECRITNCNNRNPNGTCREATININTLKMCSKCNTKTRQKTGNLDVTRELNP